MKAKTKRKELLRSWIIGMIGYCIILLTCGLWAAIGIMIIELAICNEMATRIKDANDALRYKILGPQYDAEDESHDR